MRTLNAQTTNEKGASVVLEIPQTGTYSLTHYPDGNKTTADKIGEIPVPNPGKDIMADPRWSEDGSILTFILQVQSQ